MKKLNLTLAAALTITAFAATGAFAFFDADFQEAGWENESTVGRNLAPEEMTSLDADLTEAGWDGPVASRPVEVGFHPILDADIGMGAGNYSSCRIDEVAIR